MITRLGWSSLPGSWLRVGSDRAAVAGDGRLVLLALLTEGLLDKEISRRLVILERIVHHHVAAVLFKIGVPSRAAAIREAAKMGIGTPI